MLISQSLLAPGDPKIPSLCEKSHLHPRPGTDKSLLFSGDNSSYCWSVDQDRCPSWLSILPQLCLLLDLVLIQFIHYLFRTIFLTDVIFWFWIFLVLVKSYHETRATGPENKRIARG